jgi:hypothetical protein
MNKTTWFSSWNFFWWYCVWSCFIQDFHLDFEDCHVDEYSGLIVVEFDLIHNILPDPDPHLGPADLDLRPGPSFFDGNGPIRCRLHKEFLRNLSCCSPFVSLKFASYYCLGLVVEQDPEPDRHHDRKSGSAAAMRSFPQPARSIWIGINFSGSDPALRIIPDPTGQQEQVKKTIED